MTLLDWDTAIEVTNLEEAELLPPLVELLRRRGWIRPGSIVRTELSWAGRRVDLATLNASRGAMAFELKLGSFSRVLEQAMYNRLSFDRSWIVVSSMPLARNLETAREHGVGVIVLEDHMKIVCPALRQPRTSPVVRARLLRTLKAGTS
jgi:hypothetical protein